MFSSVVDCCGATLSPEGATDGALFATEPADLFSALAVSFREEMFWAVEGDEVAQAGLETCDAEGLGSLTRGFGVFTWTLPA